MTAEPISSAPAVYPDIISALKTASAKTGSDFEYLLATAKRESSLDANAHSRTSSATGLFQFVDQTWLGLVKRYGGQHGLGPYAAAIQENAKGHYEVSSPEAKSAILALRANPQLAALMAGEAASDTKEFLEDRLGRGVCAGELYAAHFLGDKGACQLIQCNETSPAARADQIFPQAAKANRSVFYKPDGTPKSVSEVYNWAITLPGGAHPVSVSVKAPPAMFAASQLRASTSTTQEVASHAAGMLTTVSRLALGATNGANGLNVRVPYALPAMPVPWVFNPPIRCRARRY